MSCKYKYNNKWYSEEQVKKLIESEISKDNITLELLKNNSFVVEVNTAKSNEDKQVIQRGDNEEFTFNGSIFEYKNGEYLKDDDIIDIIEYETAKNDAFTNLNTSYYSNLTVPGGTNYTENEIATPAITPNIKGHAQFSTDNGIGWFRSDDQVVGGKFMEYELPDSMGGGPALSQTEGGKNTKTRRILEVQSDLFQKGRDKKDLIEKASINYDIEQNPKTKEWLVVNNTNDVPSIVSKHSTEIEAKKSKESFLNNQNKESSSNQFLQLLNKNNNWVTFFVKSIIQDSAKKGYEKVLFPKGDTAAKIEGHQTLEEFKKQKEYKIKEIKEEKSKIKPDYEFDKNGNILGDHTESTIQAMDSEIAHLKQELADVESGQTQLSSIASFYENIVTNILKKSGYNPVEVTDEYGNKWNETKVKDSDFNSIQLAPLSEEQGGNEGIFDFDEKEKIKPSFDKIISTKKSLINIVDSNLKQIRKDKKTYSANKDILKELIAKEEDLQDRLKDLSIELKQMEKMTSLDVFIDNTSRHFDRIDNLLESGNVLDIKEAKTLIDFYKMFDFDTNSRDPLFSTEGLLDENGNKKLTDLEFSQLQEIASKARDKERILDNKEKKLIEDSIAELKQSKSLKSEDLKYDSLFSSLSGLKDVPYSDMFLMDVTNGIFSSNGIVPEAMKISLENAVAESMSKHVNRKRRLEAIIDDVEKELTAKGYGLKVFGRIKGVSFDLFMAKDENGGYTAEYVTRYSSKYKDSFSKMWRAYNENKVEAGAEKNPILRSQITELANKSKENWYQNNADFIDINSIEEIRNDPRFKDFVTGEFKAGYAQDLINKLGQKAYNEILEEQKKLLEDFIIQQEIVKETNRDNISITEVQKEANIERWLKYNNPFLSVSNFYNNTESVIGNDQKVYHKYKYSKSFPKKTRKVVDTNGAIAEQDSGYYDKAFTEIESSDNLYEYHKILTELTEDIHDAFPAETSKLLTSKNAVMGMQRGISEILLDPKTNIIAKLVEAYKQMLDNFKKLFGENKASLYSFAKINPVTGKPEYEVASHWYKSNKKDINRKRFVYQTKIENIIGQDLSNKTIVDVYAYPGLASFVADMLNVHVNDLQKRLASSDLTALNLFDVVKQASTHEVIANQSVDLSKIMLAYSDNLALYEARNAVSPLLQVMKSHYDKIKSLKTNVMGQIQTDENGKPVVLEQERIRAKEQMGSWFMRAVLGDYSSKNEIGNLTSTLSEKMKNLDMTPEEEKKNFASLLSKFKPDGDIKTRQEKKFTAFIDDLIAQEKDEKKIEKLSKIRDSIGSRMSLVALIDNVYRHIRFLGMGYNLDSGITNYMEGQIANQLTAARGNVFTQENIYRATNLMWNSSVKALSGGLLQTANAKKISAVMARYDILQDARNELQKAQVKSSFNFLKGATPYVLTERVEYLNQAPLMLAVMFDTKITDINNENSISVYDAMDENGNLLEAYRTEENINNWEKTTGDDYKSFKIKVTKAIVITHGDYDKLRGSMAKEFISGKAILMFKGWLPRQIYARFGQNQMDLELGTRVEGFYRSHSKSSALIKGASVGFLIGGVPLAVALGGASFTLATIFGNNTNTGEKFFKELAITAKEAMLSFPRMAINSLSGKNIIKSEKYDSFTERDQLSIGNYKALMNEISLILTYTAGMLLVKAIFGGEEDKEKHNYMINKLTQLAGQATIYSNPMELYETTTSLPAMSFAKNIARAGKELNKLVSGDKNKFIEKSEKLVLPSIFREGLGFSTKTLKQYEELPFDKWFDSPEVKAERKLSQIRKEEAEEIKEDNPLLSDKQVKKQVRQKYRYLKPKTGETYQDLLKEFEEME